MWPLDQRQRRHLSWQSPEEIGMFVTSLLAPDNVFNIVPNSKLFGDTIQNYSVHGCRRVELVAQLDNSADVGRAIALLKEGIKQVPNSVCWHGGRRRGARVQ